MTGVVAIQTGHARTILATIRTVPGIDPLICPISAKFALLNSVAAALRCFRRENVDAVIHCGDFAHRGQTREMEFHAETWNKIFPGNLAPDGHKVEKLFVNGNHDVIGGTYGTGFRADMIYPDPEELAKHLLVTDMSGNWQRIWGEPFEEVWHKVVKGYHFFGRHYDVDEMKMAALVKKVASATDALKTQRPFFLLSHIRPSASLVKALRPYRNAVGFFGHLHRSATDWNNIFFYEEATFPHIQIPSCEPRGSGALSDRAECGAIADIGGGDNVGKCRQGYVVRLYDEMMVVSRREFGEGGSLGPDWLMPLGKYDPHPFMHEELKKAIGEPQFRAGAKLEVEVGEKAGAGELSIRIPLADGNPDSRVYAYEVAVAGDDTDKKLYKAVYAAGVNMGLGHETAGGVTTLEISTSELPSGGSLTIVVRPMSSLGTRGRVIESSVGRRVVNREKEQTKHGKS